MYKTEYVLGLIGSILAAMVAVLSFLGCLIGALFINAPFISSILSNVRVPYDIDLVSLLGSVSGLIIIIAVMWFVFAAAAFILGFIGTSKLNKDDRSGGVLLIVAGVLSLITVCEFIPFVLFLVGGIMAQTKKQAVN